MFLAWKEIKYNKGRFSLIIALIVLVSYLVYFLSSLAYGLASSYTNGINKIDCNIIYLSEDSNDNIMMSMLNDDDFINLNNTHKAKMGLFPAIVINDKTDSKKEVFVFGVEDITYFLPNTNYQLKDNEIIVDDGLKDLGYQVGDLISLSGSKLEWKIVDFVKKSTYQTAPIIYVSLEQWKEYRFNDASIDLYNAIWSSGEIEEVDGLKAITLKEYTKTLPGYTAQVLTFSLMIIFLIIIIAFVLGIFIYVLTIQKQNIFGVMKAQGISSRYIGNSVIIQTFILVFIGCVIGFILTIVSGLALKGIVPFANNSLFYLIITVLFFVFALFGALFSYRAISKIDPVKAIG